MISALRLGIIGFVSLASLLTGCATSSHAPASEPEYDYTPYKNSNPTTILVLPPINESTEVIATYGVLAQVTRPLAEAGYYVLPVAMVDEVFQQNGLTSPNDMHEVPPAKLHDIFGADAALFIDIKKYGTSYKVIDSETAVRLHGRLVDLPSGATIWSGSGSYSNDETKNQNQGLGGALISAIINQMIDTSNDRSYKAAETATERLLTPEKRDGILYGPHSPFYKAP